MILQFQGYDIFLQLFVSSLISFISVLHLSEYRCFPSLERFIPRYFILLVAMVNGVVPLISLSELSFFVYRYPRDFCAFFLYFTTLLNLLISSHSFLMVSLGFSGSFTAFPIYSRNFLLFFKFYFIFKLYKSFLIALARTSKTMLNKSGESGHTCLLCLILETVNSDLFCF